MSCGTHTHTHTRIVPFAFVSFCIIARGNGKYVYKHHQRSESKYLCICSGLFFVCFVFLSVFISPYLSLSLSFSCFISSLPLTFVQLSSFHCKLLPNVSIYSNENTLSLACPIQYRFCLYFVVNYYYLTCLIFQTYQFRISNSIEL